MQGTYYETNIVSNLIFVVVICAIFYRAMYRFEKKARKKGRSIACLACENRGGDYRPENCMKCHCKFYR